MADLAALTREDLVYYVKPEKNEAGAVARFTTILGRKSSRRGVFYAHEAFNRFGLPRRNAGA